MLSLWITNGSSMNHRQKQAHAQGGKNMALMNYVKQPLKSQLGLTSKGPCVI